MRGNAREGSFSLSLRLNVTMTVTLQRLFTHETKDGSCSFPALVPVSPPMNPHQLSCAVVQRNLWATHALRNQLLLRIRRILRHMRCLQSRIDTRRPQPPSRASPTNKSERQRVAFLSSIRLYVIAPLNKFSRLQLHARGRKEHGMASVR
ncbi:hypothetical protein FOBRF1_007994 [Fusarium oxysporum]